MAFIIAAPTRADEVNKINKRANRLYDQGKYDEALKMYDDALLLDPSDSRLKMNRGSALYQMGELEEAEKSYIDALAAPANKRSQADAHYNLGNIQYRQGEMLERAGDAQQARGKYSQALENYINTLKIRPNDKDAKWNLQLAHQKVGLLENQENQQQQQDDKQDGDDKDDKEQQQSKQDDKDNKDDKEQDQQQQEQEQEEQDMKKEEAERLIEQYADDSDSLNKPPMRRGKIRQPERDW